MNKRESSQKNKEEAKRPRLRNKCAHQKRKRKTVLLILCFSTFNNRVWVSLYVSHEMRKPYILYIKNSKIHEKSDITFVFLVVKCSNVHLFSLFNVSHIKMVMAKVEKEVIFSNKVKRSLSNGFSTLFFFMILVLLYSYKLVCSGSWLPIEIHLFFYSVENSALSP